MITLIFPVIGQIIATYCEKALLTVYCENKEL